MQSIELNEFRRVLRRFEREINIHLREKGCCSGLTMSQCHVLLAISEHKQVTTVELTEELAMNKGNLSKIIDSLVTLGYVERTQSKEDRRYSKLEITQKGRTKSKAVNNSSNAHYRSVFENIPEWKHKEIIENLSILTLAFNAQGNEILKEEKKGDSCCK